MSRFTITDFCNVQKPVVWEFSECPIEKQGGPVSVRLRSFQMFGLEHIRSKQRRVVRIETSSAFYRAFRKHSNPVFEVTWREDPPPQPLDQLKPDGKPDVLYTVVQKYKFGYVPHHKPVKPRNPEMMRELAEFLFFYEDE